MIVRIRNIEQFENHNKLEILEHFDAPVVYTFLTKSKELYLAYFGNSNQEYETWMYISISKSNVKKLVSKEISIRDVFSLSLDYYLTEVSKSSNNIVQFKESSFVELDEIGYIPGKGVYLW